jgi:hypothetical protein
VEATGNRRGRVLKKKKGFISERKFLFVPAVFLWDRAGQSIYPILIFC